MSEDLQKSIVLATDSGRPRANKSSLFGDPAIRESLRLFNKWPDFPNSEELTDEVPLFLTGERRLVDTIPELLTPEIVHERLVPASAQALFAVMAATWYWEVLDGQMDKEMAKGNVDKMEKALDTMMPTNTHWLLDQLSGPRYHQYKEALKGVPGDLIRALKDTRTLRAVIDGITVKTPPERRLKSAV